MSFRKSLFTVVASMAVAASVQAAPVVTYLVDMGPTSSGSPWNDINDGFSHTLINSSGAATTATVISTGWSGAAANAVTYMTGAAQTAFGGPSNNAAVDTAYDNSFATPPQLVFGNLDPALKYTFTIFASRNATGNRTGVYTLTGANTASGTLDAATNWSNVLVLSDLSPKADKSLTLSAALDPANTSGYVYLNAIKIEAIAVPEPVSLGALGLIGMACLRRRRA